MTNQDLHELTAAYALDALDDDDRRVFEEHLGECDDCRAELASMEDTAGALAYAVEGPAPSADLRTRIVAAAQAERPTVVALRPHRTRLYVATAAAIAACAALAIGLTLAFQGGGGPASSRLALSVSSSGAAQLASVGFAPAPAGKVYEVWLIQGGVPSPADVFKGGSRHVSELGQVPKGTVIAVTVERAPGAKQPTGKIIDQTVV